MAESIQDIERRLEIAVAPGFRERLLDKGLARGLIWRDGELPADAPLFPPSLTEDLLDYAHTVMAMSLRLRSLEVASRILERAFLVAGESIEAAIHHGDDRSDQAFHRVTAAVAFHLGGYSARAYSMLPEGREAYNLAPTEKALVQLLRRKLDEMHVLCATWLLDAENNDDRIADRLRNDEGFDEVDAAHTLLTTSFMRGLALFDHAITAGSSESAADAKAQMIETSEAARDLNAVSHWWTATLASHLVDDLWQLSLYRQIPTLPDSDSNSREWNVLRRNYIQRLRAGSRSAIELWPSQLVASRRAVDPTDNLVVSLPTSAGKTRIAELCILRALSAGRRVVYVTPLRALSAQVERDIAETFVPLGFSVSSLYGSAGIESGDAEMLRDGKIVVSTPEKLDFALRNDPSVIDDVGLLVLDEGHMLGPNEREVRYEALVQRLLRRPDASTRRIVCMSALFPPPEEMSDFVAWIRQDASGESVHSIWRPTRQRFGVIRWTSDAARLDVQVGHENPFVSRFIESNHPPENSRRRRTFPSDKNELTLAVAWRFVQQRKNVLIYCPLRTSVETLGELLLKCIEHCVLEPLREINERIRNAMASGVEWLGEHHPAVQCLRYGVALHHGGLPRQFLIEVERLLRSGDCPITIASPTLAQGLNLSASVLLVPSIWRNRSIIPTTEFANVAGRAGRAFADIEGLVLHIVWEKSIGKSNYAVWNWQQLVDGAKAPQIRSGILLLAVIIYDRIAEVAGVAVSEVVDYVTGHGRIWDFTHAPVEEPHLTAAEWERDIASLDAAILALLDAETIDGDLGSKLDDVLSGSLFSRQIESYDEGVNRLLRAFVAARAKRIWEHTSVVQRRGYYAAGIGLAAGQFLDANLAALIGLLKRAETALTSNETEVAAATLLEFAELVLQTAPFRIPKALPAGWKDALLMWIRGGPAAEVIRTCDDEGVNLLQETLTYRLPWAMEAVRVHALAVGQEGAADITGLAALAVESGTSSAKVMVLLRNGLNSREAAIAAVTSTGAAFENREGIRSWLHSDEIVNKTAEAAWPTEQSRRAWLEFYETETKSGRRKWKRDIQEVPVEWRGQAPPRGTSVVIEPGGDQSGGLVLSPSFLDLGKIKSALLHPRWNIVGAKVAARAGTVEVEYFGAPAP